MHLLRYAGTIIGHLEDHRLALEVMPGADDQRAAPVSPDHGLLGVDDQVEQHLLDLVRVGDGCGRPAASASMIVMLVTRCS